MYPLLPTDDSHPNAPLFSPCSLSAISSVVKAKGSCLEELHVCKSSSGPCCFGDHLLPAGVTCAPAAPGSCMQDAVCSGAAAACPAPVALPDGAFCTVDGDAGSCESGVCIHSHTTSCATIGMDACTLESNACVVACTDGHVCRPLGACNGEELGWTSGDCVAAAQNTPCLAGDAQGLCSGSTALCALCADGSCAADAVEAMQCDFDEIHTSVCSEPCGSGLQVTCS